MGKAKKVPRDLTKEEITNIEGKMQAEMAGALPADVIFSADRRKDDTRGAMSILILIVAILAFVAGWCVRVAWVNFFIN